METEERKAERERLLGAIPLLLEWFDRGKRDLPWRHTRDPYAIWVSEIMLQQTRVEAVKGYYERFLTVFPDVESLAKADDEHLYKAWEGLGYYSRARNLRAAAQTVMEEYGGELPRSRDGLRALRGIGDYTAGSIASIAFGLPEPAVDGNVLRVLSRLFASERNIDENEVKRYDTALLKEVYRAEYARELTESLMELGALVCLPNGAPDCPHCPLKECCLGKDAPERYPVRTPKQQRKKEKKSLLALETPNGFYLEKRKNGLLKGLWQFPLRDGFLTNAELQEQLDKLGFKGDAKKIADGRHIFTHIEWEIEVYYGYGMGMGTVPFEKLDAYPFPGAISKFFPAIFSARSRRPLT